VAGSELGTFGALAFAAGVTGGVEEPRRDGIDIDESEEVEETGEGTAMTLVVGATLLDVATVALVVGANKFDMVGECFLLPPLLFVAVIDEEVVVDCPPEGEHADGDEVFGDESDVDVVVHVAGILLLLLFTATDVIGALPFGMVAVVLACCPLFCPT
jgi:hypothetical protein